MAEGMELNVRLAMESQSFQQQITAINREMRVVQSEFANASSALGNFGAEEQRLEARSASLTQQIQMSQQKVDLLTAAHERARQTLETNVAINEDLRQSLERATTAYNQSASSTGENSTESLRLRAAMDALNTEYTQSNALILRNSGAVDNLSIRLNNTQSAQNRLQNELTQTNADLEAQRNGMDDLGQSAEENQERFREFGEELSEMGRVAAIGIAAIGAAFLAAVTGGVKMSDDLTRALNGVQSSTGTADEEMAGMKETLLAIYNNNFGESFEDIGAAMAVVRQQTGFAGEALQSATESALALRDTLGFEVKESIRTVDMMMKQFGLSSDDAFNLIAQGAQAGLDKNGNLLDSINEYSVHFEQLGFTSEEMFNMMANGAATGVFDIDKLGDAMKEFGIRSKDGSKTSSEGFQALGLDAEELTKAFAAGGDTAKEAFSKTTQALFEMEDPVAREAAGVALFGTQWEDVGVKGVEALVNTRGEIGLTEDALKKINDVKYNSFGESVEGIKRQLLTGIVLPLGEEVLPKMNEFGNYLKENMPQIVEGIKPIVMGLLDTFKALADNMALIIPVLAGVVSGLVAFKVISTVSGLIEAFRLATVGTTAAQWLLNAAMTANPIGLLAVAIAALVAAGVALWMNWDTIKVKIAELWVYLTSMWGNIKADIGASVEQIKTDISAKWDQIKASTSEAWNNIKTDFSNKVEEIKTIVSNKFQEIRQAVSDKMDAVKTGIRDKWNETQQFLADVDLKQIGRDIIQGLINGIGDKITALKDKVKDVSDALTGKIRSLLEIESPSKVFQAIGQYTVDGLIVGIGDKVPEVGNAMDGIVSIVAGKAADIIAAGASIGQQFSSALQSNISHGGSGGGSGSSGGIKNIPGVGNIVESSGGMTINTKSGSYDEKTGQYSVTNFKTGKTMYKNGSKDDYEKDFDTFHDGGWVGDAFRNLKLDEIPAILQKGEFVLSRKMIDGIAKPVNQTGATSMVSNSNTDNSRSITQNVVINSPKSLTPSEVAWQSRNAMRELALSF